MYLCFVFFFFKQKTAYEMRISDWSSDVCSSDLDDALDLAQWLQPGYGDLYRRHRSLFRAPTGGGTPASSRRKFDRWGPAANGTGDAGAWRSRHVYRWLKESRRQGRQEGRSDKRRVGKWCVRKCRSRWAPSN